MVLGPVFHLALRHEWEGAQVTGTYDRSTIGRSLTDEGFIHAGLAHQVPGVAARYYRGRDDVVLLTIDPARCPGTWKLESPVPGAEPFPHLYGAVPVGAVLSAVDVPVDAAGDPDVAAVLPDDDGSARHGRLADATGAIDAGFEAGGGLSNVVIGSTVGVAAALAAWFVARRRRSS